MDIKNWFITGLLLGVVPQALGGEMLTMPDGGAADVPVRPGRVAEIAVAAGVSRLVRSGQTGSLKVEHAENRVFVTPVSAGPAELIVIDRKGQSFRLNFRVDERLPPVDRLLLGREAELDAQNADDHALVMMRALLRRESPPAATVSTGGWELYKDERLMISVERVYETPSLRAYAGRVRNLTGQSQVVPLQRLRVPGLLLAWVQADILPGGREESLAVYLVVRR